MSTHGEGGTTGRSPDDAEVPTMNDYPDHYAQVYPTHASGDLTDTPWASPEPYRGICSSDDHHGRRKTLLLLVPSATPDGIFLQMLSAHLKLKFGANIQLEVRTDSRCPRRCQYRLSGEWCRPGEVHNALITLFSVFQSETTDEDLS